MKTINPDIMARNLAIHYIKHSVDSGCSEDTIRSMQGGGGRSHKHWHDAEDGFGGYDISVGGWDPKTHKRIPPTKVVVTEVYGVEGFWVFSLHDIYEECKKGQLSLL